MALEAEITARLNLIPYDGSIEIKDRDGIKYIYIRKRVLGRNTSTYVGSYSDELFASISKLLKDVKEYKNADKYYSQTKGCFLLFLFIVRVRNF